MMKGKKTYTGVGTLVLTGALMWLGLDEGEATSLAERMVTGIALLGGAALAAYGRWDATRNKDG